MVEYYPLDKIFTQGVDYSLPADRFYVIKAVGTDATTPAWLKIDGVDTGRLLTDFAPIRTRTSNLLGPLELDGLSLVAPPNKILRVEGPSGARVRAVGLIGRLAVGEVVPADLLARFANQGKSYRTYVRGTATLAAAGASWPAGAETEVVSLTPRTIEEYVFNNFVGALLSNAATAPAEGAVAIRFYLDGLPLDVLTPTPGRLGIEYYSMPDPPAETTDMKPFTLHDLPIRVLGDHTLSIRAVNVSGAAIAAATGAAMTMRVTAVADYLAKG